MNRYDYGRWFGAVLAVLGVGVVALTYPPSFSLAVQGALLAGAGVLFVLAGTASRLRDRAGPHRLMGVGDVLLGASLVVSAFGTGATDSGLFYRVVVGLGGASMAFVGLVYVFRPGSMGLGEDGFPLDRTA